MSRTGPGYVENEAELFSDLELKRENGEITEETSQAFIDLYEFAKEIGDDVKIGQAKNANFGLIVNAHQGEHSGNPSVFYANVNGAVKIWPASMPLTDDADSSVVDWDREDFVDLKRAFQSLGGVPRGEKKAPFETIASGDNLGEFKTIVEEFVTACRQKAERDSK